jgi:hypothetical protein
MDVWMAQWSKRDCLLFAIGLLDAAILVFEYVQDGGAVCSRNGG